MRLFLSLGMAVALTIPAIANAADVVYTLYFITNYPAYSRDKVSGPYDTSPECEEAARAGGYSPYGEYSCVPSYR
jgi:hypothetical protein